MSLEQQSLCWVVNLPQRKDRRKSIIQTFQKERHLPFEFVSPVPIQKDQSVFGRRFSKMKVHYQLA